jgi:hypothetical protein
LLGVITLICIVVVVATNGLFSRATGQPGVLQPQWAPAFGWMAGFGGAGLALMYLAVSAAGVAGLWKQVNRTKLLIAAAAGIIFSIGVLFGAVYKAPSPLNTVPWALIVWIGLGVLWSFIVLRQRSRSADTETSRPAPGVVPGRQV